ncbi:hypothetical protein P691DRAFT_417879 [Macrolepiota fuliginosa MF-IS2]|uniref:Uncharacterized protein n=1 Tax=Macrolepiota fuliginosa MF-IS2 TaxID=1400762 RepID=A0A9P5X5R9_9AGAR|nr:hypothetical protein P691DRAFT_417879 [Macrolepiota fuliginosa MF-IS2]
MSFAADRASRGEPTGAFEATFADSKREEALLRAELIILRSQRRRLLRSTTASLQTSQSSALRIPGVSGWEAPPSSQLNVPAHVASPGGSGALPSSSSPLLGSPHSAAPGRMIDSGVLPRLPKRQASPLPTLESQAEEDPTSPTTLRARVVLPKPKRICLGALSSPSHDPKLQLPGYNTGHQHQTAHKRGLQTTASSKSKNKSSIVYADKSSRSLRDDEESIPRRPRTKGQFSDLYGRKAPTAILGLAPSIFSIPSQDDLVRTSFHGFG